jgi:hypothetical protein
MRVIWTYWAHVWRLRSLFLGTGYDNFYPRVWVRVQISTRSLFAGGRVIALPDPNPTRCHPYRQPSCRFAESATHPFARFSNGSTNSAHWCKLWMTAGLSASARVGCSIIIFELSVTVKPSPLPSHVGNRWVCKSVLYKVGGVSNIIGHWNVNTNLISGMVASVLSLSYFVVVMCSGRSR